MQYPISAFYSCLQIVYLLAYVFDSKPSQAVNFRRAKVVCYSAFTPQDTAHSTGSPIRTKQFNLICLMIEHEVAQYADYYINVRNESPLQRHDLSALSTQRLTQPNPTDTFFIPSCWLFTYTQSSLMLHLTLLLNKDKNIQRVILKQTTGILLFHNVGPAKINGEF